jgi:hypothetical protein
MPPRAWCQPRSSNPTPDSKRAGRAHIPAGYLLPAKPRAPSNEITDRSPDPLVDPQLERIPARYTGYWLPQLLQSASDARRLAWNQAKLPMHYAIGKHFDDWRRGLVPDDGRFWWH